MTFKIHNKARALFLFACCSALTPETSGKVSGFLPEKRRLEAEWASDFSFSHLCFLFSLIFYVGERSALVLDSVLKVEGNFLLQIRKQPRYQRLPDGGACFPDPCVYRQLLFHPSSCSCHEWGKPQHHGGGQSGWPMLKSLATGTQNMNVHGEICGSCLKKV